MSVVEIPVLDVGKNKDTRLVLESGEKHEKVKDTENDNQGEVASVETKNRKREMQKLTMDQVQLGNDQLNSPDNEGWKTVEGKGFCSFATPPPKPAVSNTSRFSVLKGISEIAEEHAASNRKREVNGGPKGANNNNRVTDVRLKLNQIQETIFAGCLESSALEEERSLREQYQTLSCAEECFLKAKARCNWLELGDRNTRFFHSLVTMNNSRNKLHFIRNSQGVLLTDPEEVVIEATSYFQQMFTKNLDVTDTVRGAVITSLLMHLLWSR